MSGVGTRGLLTVKGLSVSYGRIQALHQVSLSVERGEIVSIIGANGAGKSTLLWTIMGVLRPEKGRVELNGQPLLPQPDRVAAQGLALVPERRRLFGNLTVKENLLMGAYLKPWDRSTLSTMNQVFSLFPVLKERLNQSSSTLSGGEQQMLAIGRALMGRPKLLLLDEPSLGLAPTLASQVFQAIEAIKSEGTSVLLAEQNAFKALDMADRAYVLEVGRVALEGPGKSVLLDPGVQKAYLGVAR